jgi:hypothetical protein
MNSKKCLNKKRIIGWQRILLLLFTIHYSLFTFSQVGTWKNYLAYHEIQQICAAGNYLFVRASNDLYQYNQKDQSIYTYDRTNGLSDTNIKLIAWNKQAKRLIAVYDNSNIDLVETNGNVTNISALYTKTMTEDKTVNSIRIEGNYAYLVCGFGIVKVNMQRAEIAETYTPNHPEYPTSLPAEDNSDYDKYIELVKTLSPDGPHYNHFGFMRFLNNKLYTCNGDYTHSSGIQIYDNNNWINYQNEGISDVTGLSYMGAFCLDVDPKNENHIFAGSRNGLYEFKDGQFVSFYNSNNSPIEPFDGKTLEYELVSDVKYDSNGDIWLLNSSAPNTSMIRYVNGSFTKLNHAELMKLNSGAIKNRSNAEMRGIFFDSQGLMWFVNNNWYTPAFYQYDTNSDKLTAYENFVNQDGTVQNPQLGVRCIAEDLQHNIWIGTSAGPFVFERKEINNGGTTLTQVKVPRNDGTNYVDYLLANTDILSMAIDGGNRKWFGTNGNGVYLISADNMTQILHFTTADSPLLSNIVKSIAVNPASGEVFFGTDNGLCSYISDATQSNTEMTSDNVWAYPNPVEPNYTGPITITGLTLNADVKILSANGAIINEGRSNGGTYTWDGCDQKGRRVASGVYMVATATSDGKKGTVCKIAIIN